MTAILIYHTLQLNNKHEFGSSSFFTSISIDRVELQIEQNYSRGIDRGRIAFDRDDVDRYAQL